METSIILLAQPMGAVLWGWLFFAEQLSPIQWSGVALVLLGVTLLSPRTGASRIGSKMVVT